VSDKKDDATAKAALKGTRPVVALTLQQEKGSNKELPAPITLAFYSKEAKGGKDAKDRKLYATVSNLDPLFELDPAAKDRVDKELRDLRLSKLITSMERFTIKRIEFSGKPLGEPPLVLRNENGNWKMEGQKGEPDPERIQAFLDKISGKRIVEFLPGIPPGQADGITIKLGDEKGEPKRQLALWRAKGRVYARDLLSKRDEAYIVDPSIWDDVPQARDSFTKKAAPAAPPSGLPAAPVPPPAQGGVHSHGGPAGAPPAPDKPLIPVPEAPKKK
jgi:hypothetical protein